MEKVDKQIELTDEEIGRARQFLIEKGMRGFANHSCYPRWLAEFAARSASAEAEQLKEMVGKAREISFDDGALLRRDSDAEDENAEDSPNCGWIAFRAGAISAVSDGDGFKIFDSILEAFAALQSAESVSDGGQDG
jgi:hypothetical protein